MADGDFSRFLNINGVPSFGEVNPFRSMEGLR